MAKKKIVFVMNNFWLGGTEKFLLGLLSKLSSQYEIKIATVLGPGELEPQFRKLPLTITHLSPVIFANRKLPLRLFWLLAAPITFLRLLIFLIKVKPDAVVTSLFQSDVLGIFAARLAGIKKRILIQHDVQKLNPFRWRLKYLLAVQRATGFVAVSAAVKNFLVSYWRVPEKKGVVIGNGIDFTSFAFLKKGDENDIVFGVLGRLEPVKGHRTLLEALILLKEKSNLSPRVILAGGGSLENELKIFASSHSLQNVLFMGSLLDPRKFFELIDVAVFPSLEEGFGMVILESLASMKIILASDIAPFREIIGEEETGAFFRPGDRDALAELIKFILENPAKREEYLRNIKGWLSGPGGKYDLENVAASYKAILD